MAEASGRWRRYWDMGVPLVCVLAAGLWAYHNSFAGAFVFDDVQRICDNPRIRHLWPIWETIRGTSRPFVELSLALNYVLGGLHVWSYHAVNLTVHLLAALTLFGIVKRTLSTKPLQAHYGSSTSWLALTIALLWLVHPLQTESVTYVIQRAESLMGLCYLLTLYCVIRGSASRHQRCWYVAAILACAAGMASKPVMVTAPLLILLYDRAFIGGTFRRALARRKGLYLGLSATWVLLTIALSVKTNERPSAGFAFKQITPLAYAATQPGVLLHYLKLSVWPQPLYFKYNWPVARSVTAIVLPSLVIGPLLLATGWALRVRPALGFLGTWFFLILAPSSSIIPIMAPAFEHRMYLSLAAVIALLVLSGHRVLHVLLPSRRSLRQGLGAGCAFLLILTFGSLTIRRNWNYRSAEALWRDMIAKCPNEVSAYSNLAGVLIEGDRLDEGIAYSTAALHLEPNYPEAHYNLGLAFVKQGRLEEAIEHCKTALRLQPGYVEAYSNLGAALALQGKLSEAIAYYEETLRLNPDHVEAHNNLGNALTKQGRLSEAIVHYKVAIRLKPEFVEARNNLGVALVQESKFAEAIAQYEEALRLRPDFVGAHYSLGNALSIQGQFPEAIAQYEEALHLKPDFPEAHNNLGLALAQQARLADAIAHYEAALRLKPKFAEAHNNFGLVLVQEGKVTEATAHYETALRLQPDYPTAHNNLGSVLAQQGKLDEAIAHYTEALRLKPDYAKAHNNLGVALAQKGKLTESAAHFSEALRLNPELTEASQNLGRIQHELRESHGADSP